MFPVGRGRAYVRVACPLLAHGQCFSAFVCVVGCVVARSAGRIIVCMCVVVREGEGRRARGSVGARARPACWASGDVVVCVIGSVAGSESVIDCVIVTIINV